MWTEEEGEALGRRQGAVWADPCAGADGSPAMKCSSRVSEGQPDEVRGEQKGKSGTYSPVSKGTTGRRRSRCWPSRGAEGRSAQC